MYKRRIAKKMIAVRFFFDKFLFIVTVVVIVIFYN